MIKIESKIESLWAVHRLLLDRLGLGCPFSGKAGRKRLLFLSERDPICHMQVFPFIYHRAELRARHGIEVRELPLARFLAGARPRAHIDAVCFQSWFDLSPEALRDLAQRVRAAFPGAKIAYFDWFAPTDLRYAAPLDDLVDVYVKKQVLRDFTLYGKSTLGDTNLTDYYARRFDLEGYPPTHYPVPEGFKDKLWLGTHFAFTPHMLPYFLGAFPEQPRDIDLHARIAVKGTEWYSRMRQEALDRTLALESRLNVVCRGRVSREEYFKELFRAKLCFSPFGYGEVCWRDFEAMFTGSLLLKPDMGHLECYPDVFQPYETYVPLAWDLSDLDEKIDYYLAHPEERNVIARHAFERLHDYFVTQRFLEDVHPFLERLHLLEGRP